MVSNGVPAGGAIGLGVVYEMLSSYGFGSGPAASAAAISSAFNVFAALVMPVVGMLALLAAGEVRSGYVVIAVAGILGVGLALAGFGLSLRTRPGPVARGTWRTGPSTWSRGVCVDRHRRHDLVARGSISTAFEASQRHSAIAGLDVQEMPGRRGRSGMWTWIC
jgi:hypothetical protein